MKKIPIYLLSLVFAYGLFGIYAIPYILVNIAPNKIATLTKSKVCEIEKATFHPFTFELTLSKIKLSNPQNEELATVEEFYLDFNPLDSIRNQKIFIETIDIKNPSVNLIKYEDGTFNFSYLLNLGDKEEKKEETKPLNLHIKSLKIKNATLQYVDKDSTQKLESVVEKFNLTLTNLDTSKDFSDLLQLHLEGALKTNGFLEVESKFALTLLGKIDPKEDEAFNFNLKTLTFGINDLIFKDRSPKKPYSLSIKKIELSSGNFNSKLDTPFGAKITTEKIEMSRLDTHKNHFFLDKILLDIEKFNLQKQHILIREITLTNPSLTLKRVSSGKIDLEDFIPQKKKPSTQKEATKDGEKSNKIWEYEIKKIEIQNGKFDISDEVPSPKVQFLLDNTHLRIDDFSSDSSKNITLDFRTNLNQTSKIKLIATTSLGSFNGKGNFGLEKIELPLFNPYGKKLSYLEPKRGNISTNGEFEYLNKQLNVTGKIALDDWLINDSRDNSVLFGWNKIGITPFKFTQKNNSLTIKQLNIDGLYTNIHLNKSKILNFTTLLKNKSEGNKSIENNTTNKALSESKVAQNSFSFELQKLYIQKSSANFSDASLPIPFQTYIHNLGGVIENISSSTDRNATITLNGAVDDIGTANIGGKIYVANPKDFAKIKVVFENLELKKYTPYSMEFLGYAIDDGRLFLNLDYNLAHNILQSSNIVSINHIQLGREKEGGSPWPLGLAVAVLEDSDGIIHLDLPIEGDVNAPDFKYGKIVWKTIGNVFTKIITSPFKLFSSMLGLGYDSIEDIDFNYGEATLIPAELKKLDSVATILTKRKKLKLSIQGKYDPLEDTKAIQIQKLLKDASKIESSNMEFASLDGISLEIGEKLTASKNINLKKEKEELQKKYKNEQEFEANYRTLLIEKLLEKEVVTRDELQQLGENRSKAILDYLTNKYKITDIAIGENTEFEKLNKQNKGTVQVKLNLVPKQF